MKKRIHYRQAHSIPNSLALVSGIALALSPNLQPAQAQSFFTDFSTTPSGYPAAGNQFVGANNNSSTALQPFGTPNGNAAGWSEGSSTTSGWLVPEAASGSYAGGVALGSGNPTTSPGSGQSYIGALNLSSYLDGNGISMLTFDVMAPTVGSGAQVMVAGYYDGDADGAFVQAADTGVFAGINGNQQFGIRGAAFGSTYQSGVQPVAGDWYQITLTYDYLGSGNAGNSATIAAFNLTTGSAVNLGGTGGDFTATGASLFGSENPSTDEGIVARVSGPALLDDIAVVPEPGVVSMLAGGLGMLLIVLRRQR